MNGNTIRFICSEHGEQRLKSFCHAGVVLACGCWWRDIYGEGLVSHLGSEAAPVQQQVGRIYVQLGMFDERDEKRRRMD